MNFFHEHHADFLRAAAVLQLVLVVLNLFLISIMNWRDEVERMPLLVREVFLVHGHFIAATLAIFGVVTFRFAPELAARTNPLGSWLACGIGLFWAIRTVMQWTFYSTSHWRGIPHRTCIHWLLTLMYGSFAGFYLASV
jgi:hypothetical protein